MFLSSFEMAKPALSYTLHLVENPTTGKRSSLAVMIVGDEDKNV
jgi:hypothetical protein